MKIRVPYWPLLVVPAACAYLGSGLNVLAMAVNHNLMPVLGPGGCSAQIPDPLHSCMTHATHLKVICDWIIDTSGAHLNVESIGDMFISVYEKTADTAIYIWVALILADYNRG